MEKNQIESVDILPARNNGIFAAPFFFSTCLLLLTPCRTTAQGDSAARIVAIIKSWQLLDFQKDHIYGASVNRAYEELLKGKVSQSVIVAVIDEGVDITAEDLQGHIWTNPGEIPGNGIDDDHDGHIDDVHGWNFLGGKDGRNIYATNSEADREYARLAPRFSRMEAVPDSADPKEYAYFLKVKQKHVRDSAGRKTDMYSLEKRRVVQLTRMDSLLKVAAPGKNWYYADIQSLEPKDSLLAATRKALLSLYNNNPVISQPYYKTISLDSLISEEQQLLARLERRQSLYARVKSDPFADRKAIVGDNPFDITDTKYGNNLVGDEVYGFHGTSCSGEIAAIRGNGIGMDGVTDHVFIMPLRAVNTLQFGDEADKDIALAIRYAADHGARVISMSFGKYFSPQKQWVDEALRYAERKGVLLVHSAGNDNTDIDTVTIFPSADFLHSSGRAGNLITVGSSNADTGNALVSRYSNFGQKNVDLFAPGESIYMPVPGNRYEFNSGTSFAAPMVAGVAALILEFYPNLTPAQLKDILLKSVTPLRGKPVYRPGTKIKVDFSTLCASGGVVNAYNALKLAAKY